MNRVILSGEIGSDIVLKKTTTGQSLCNFSIEVKEKGKDGQEHKSFFDCTAWGENAEHINQYGFRGQHIAVDGKLHQCSGVGCCNCGFSTGHGCNEKIKEWLKSPHKKPTYKLNQFEYDLIQTYRDCNNYCKLSDRRILLELKDKGYFMDVDYDTKIQDILANCEAIK